MTSGPGEWVETLLWANMKAGHGKAKAFGHGLAKRGGDQWNDGRFFKETEPDLEIRSARGRVRHH